MEDVLVEGQSLNLQRAKKFEIVRKRLTQSLLLVCFVPFTMFGATNPTFSPGGGTYGGPTQVTISCSGGASAFYSKDGSTPTIDSALYKGPVTISSTATLKAICAVLGAAQYGIDDNNHQSTNGSVGWKLADTAANDDPGGSGTPTSYVEAFDSTGHSTPSLDGASLLLTQTSSSSVHQTNVLWPFLAGPCDTCTYFLTDTQVYPNSNYSGASALEIDTFNFNHSGLIKDMFGMQYCWGTGCPGGHSSWDIWNQSTTSGGAHGWRDTGATKAPTIGAWNHIQVQDHVVAGDTSCDGYPALHYDYMKLNGTTMFSNVSYCAGPLDSSWSSNVGQQYQIDIYKLSAAATINVDEAKVEASQTPSGVTSATYTIQ